MVFLFNFTHNFIPSKILSYCINIFSEQQSSLESYTSIQHKQIMFRIRAALRVIYGDSSHLTDHQALNLALAILNHIKTNKSLCKLVRSFESIWYNRFKNNWSKAESKERSFIMLHHKQLSIHRMNVDDEKIRRDKNFFPVFHCFPRGLSGFLPSVIN